MTTQQEILNYAIFHLALLEQTRIINESTVEAVIATLTESVLNEMLSLIQNNNYTLKQSQNGVINYVHYQIDLFKESNVSDSVIDEMHDQDIKSVIDEIHDQDIKSDQDTKPEEVKPSFFQRYRKTIMVATIVTFAGICIIKKGLELYEYL